MGVVVWVQEVDARAANKSICWLASKQTPERRIQLYLSCAVQLQRRPTASILRQCFFSPGPDAMEERCCVANLLKRESFSFAQNGPI